MRKRTLAALCTATALAGALGAPTAAQAAEQFPKGFHTWTDETRVYLDFGTDSPKNLKVHLRKAGTATRIATVTSFQSLPDEDPCMPSCQDDPGESGIGSAPLRLADLGKYSVDVEYTGTAGEPILHQGKATLDYHLIPTVTAFEVIGDPDIENMTVTVKGDAVSVDPRDDSRKPLPNSRLIVETSAAKTPLTTDAAGHVEVPYTFTGAEEKGDAFESIRMALRPDGSDNDHGMTNDVQIDQPWAKVTLDTTHVSGPDGSTAPVSGRASFRGHDGTDKPVPAGIPMTVSGSPFKTGADGRFTVQVPIDGKRTQSISIVDSPWLNGAGASVTSDPTASAGFRNAPSVSLGFNRTVGISGEFRRYDVPAATTLTVEAQFSSDEGKTWSTRKTVTTAVPAGESRSRVSATGIAYPGPGIWRLRYVGTAAIPSGSAAPSGPLRGYNTAIPSFNATPEPVKKGAPITITGKVVAEQDGSPDLEPVRWRQVDVFFREKGSSTWKAMGVTETDNTGTFKRTFTAGKDGYWMARYSRDSYVYFPSLSRQDFVDVK